MKRLVFIFLAILLLIFIFSSVFSFQKEKVPENTSQRDTPKNNTVSQNNDSERFSVIAENLDTPWGIAFLPASQQGGSYKKMLVTERQGTVRLIDSNGKLDAAPIATIQNVEEIGEGGLLGITAHPEFSKNNFVYLYYTYASSGNNTLNRVVRMTLRQAQGKPSRLIDEKIIIDAIPGASNHDGGRIKFGPDKLLYITTGDAQEPSLAQDRNSLAGKILRVTDEGKPASGNPFGSAQGKTFGDPRVYSYGHRNSQGITWDNTGNLWATEHGRSGVQSGLDELNFIQSGKNYGWPEIQGNETRNGMETPRQNSGGTTWAPGGAAFYNGSIFFAGLRGRALYEAIIQGDTITMKEHFSDEFGRIRDVVIGPDNMLYITTSNQDGRGSPAQEDDRIIRINPEKL